MTLTPKVLTLRPAPSGAGQKNPITSFLDGIDGDPEEIQTLREGRPARIVIDSLKSSWAVDLHLDRPVSTALIERLEKRIAARVPDVNLVHVSVHLPHQAESLRAYLARENESVLEELRDKHPVLRGWLSLARLIVDDDEAVALELPNAVAVESLAQRGIQKAIAEAIFHRLHLDCRVVLREGNFQETAKAMEAGARAYDAERMEARKKEFEERRKAMFETGAVLLGTKIKEEPLPLRDFQAPQTNVVVEGEVFRIDDFLGRAFRPVFQIWMTDNTDSIRVKVTVPDERIRTLKTGDWIRAAGTVRFDDDDRLADELILDPISIVRGEKKIREDLAPLEERRIELRCHGNMSNMEATAPISDYFVRAAHWGMSALAVTDTGVVQAFPEAYKASRRTGVKALLGMQANLVDDGTPVVWEPRADQTLDSEFVIFDIETTGLSPHNNTIIEIGAIRMKRGRLEDCYSRLVDPGRPLPEFISNLTGITDAMLAGQARLEQVLPEFLEFIGDAVLVAHNANFDVSFLRAEAKRLGLGPIKRTVLDTLRLLQAHRPDLSNYRLESIAKAYEVALRDHHRAEEDATVLARILLKVFREFQEAGLTQITEIAALNKRFSATTLRPFPATLLVKNKTGLRNLYEMVSASHLDYFYSVPRIPWSLLDQKREGLLIGASCDGGEIIDAVEQGVDDDRLDAMARRYDYLEVQPPANDRDLIGRDYETLEQLQDRVRRMVALGRRNQIPVAGVGNAHCVDEEDAIYRRILRFPRRKFAVDKEAPLFFRTTDEMLSEFLFLGEEEAKRLVLETPRAIASQIEEVPPIPSEFCPPEIENSKERIEELTWAESERRYGTNPPKLIRERIEKELAAIVGGGYAVLYLIAHELVKTSEKDGYVVGSRGSVGSSLVACLCGITEVNPLPPHHRCPKCHYIEWSEQVETGPDLIEAECPECKHPVMEREGYNIPFEVFMGFDGTKTPDIDLNFSGDYQGTAMKFIEDTFGADHVFRAGTIATVKSKTAYGFVKNWAEEHSFAKRRAEIDRLVRGCEGVRRTTGQHPGGIVVVPRSRDIHEFTPVQYPADDEAKQFITTHFDFHSYDETLVKLDILGHDVPTQLHILSKLTGADPMQVPLTDKKVLSLFTSSKGLKLKEKIDTPVGTLGIPEFGTDFVVGMLKETKPTTLGELIRISGLSHGTNVWLGNAQELIKSKTATLKQVICTRGDIMNYLIKSGVPDLKAFKIMESVRKGRGLTDEDVELMRKHNVPSWYIESCQKITYMFPKAHAVAYVLMGMRIAYFKVYHPAAFYAAYLSTNTEHFEIETVLGGARTVASRLAELRAKGREASAKEKKQQVILEVSQEMLARGIGMGRVDLYRSDPRRFDLAEGEKTPVLRPPLTALPGLGLSQALVIESERKKQPFQSIEDLVQRTKINKTVVGALKNQGCLDGLSESNQMGLF